VHIAITFRWRALRAANRSARATVRPPRRAGQRLLALALVVGGDLHDLYHTLTTQQSYRNRGIAFVLLCALLGTFVDRRRRLSVQHDAETAVADLCLGRAGERRTGGMALATQR